MRRINSCLLLMLLMACLLGGCARKPSIDTFPKIPTYAEQPAPCPAPLRCGVMMGQAPSLAEAVDRSDLLGEELKKQRIPVTVFHPTDYITRDQRLALDRVINITQVGSRMFDSREGLCTDAEVKVEVRDARQGAIVGYYDVWGRHMQPGVAKTATTVPAVGDAYKAAMANLVRMPDFMKSLSR